MARGDKWQISFAAPIPNYRFTDWSLYTSGTGETYEPRGWSRSPAFQSPRIRLASAGHAAESCVLVDHSDGSGASLLQADLPARSLSPQPISATTLFWYKASATSYISLNWIASDGSSLGILADSAVPSAADWTNHGLQPVTVTDASGLAIAVGCRSTATSTFYISEIVVRWVPATWGANSYELLTSFPDADSLYYGPQSAGPVRRFANAFSRPMSRAERAEKWVLRAHYSHLTEADYLILQRYWLGSRGMLDGFPRPVAIRPQLVDWDTSIGPDFLVGSFAGEFSFERSGGLGGHYAGDLVFEEA